MHLQELVLTDESHTKAADAEQDIVAELGFRAQGLV